MPWTGIFMSRDAMWADIHRGWGYVGNLPTMYTDPFGLLSWKTWGAALAAAGATFAVVVSAPVWVPIALGAAGTGLAIWELTEMMEGGRKAAEATAKRLILETDVEKIARDLGRAPLEKDSDGDGVPDSQDGCPNDPDLY